MPFVCLFCGMAYMTPGLSSCWDHTQNEDGCYYGNNIKIIFKNA